MQKCLHLLQLARHKFRSWRAAMHTLFLTLKSKNIATAEKHQHTNAHLTWRLNLEVIGLCCFFSRYTQVECIHVNYSSAFIHAAFLQSWLPIFFCYVRSLVRCLELEKCAFTYLCAHLSLRVCVCVGMHETWLSAASICTTRKVECVCKYVCVTKHVAGLNVLK